MLIYVGGEPRINQYKFLGIDKLSNHGNLLSPGHRINDKCFRYAIDNGKFSVWANKNKQWDSNKFIKICDSIKTSTILPDWIVVPDEVANKKETLRLWGVWEPILRKYKVPLAIAVQDGMRPEDVPTDADIIFVGGSLEWKLSTIPMWIDRFPNVHVARVNTWYRCAKCYFLGASSVDGSGWFRGSLSGQQAKDFHLFLLWRSGFCPWIDELPQDRIIYLSKESRQSFHELLRRIGGRSFKNPVTYLTSFLTLRLSQLLHAASLLALLGT